MGFEADDAAESFFGEELADGLEVAIVAAILVHGEKTAGFFGDCDESGGFFWKWPRRIPYPVTVSFGAPMPANTPAHEVRQAIQELAADATAVRKSSADLLDRRFVRNARRHWNRFAMADSTGREMTYGRALTAAMLIAPAMSLG